MKLRITLISCLLAVAAFAADVSGKWTGEMQGRNGPQQVTITLKADGNTLTGTVSGRGGDTQISDGTVNGDTVKFSVTREIQGNSMKTNYTGKIAGDDIKFTVEREGGQGRTQELTVHRSTT